MQYICGKWNNLTGGAKNVFTECLMKLPSEDTCNPIEVNLCFLKVYTSLCETEAARNFCNADGNVCSPLQDCTTQFNMYTGESLKAFEVCFVDSDLVCSDAINDCTLNN